MLFASGCFGFALAMAVGCCGLCCGLFTGFWWVSGLNCLLSGFDLFMLLLFAYCGLISHGMVLIVFAV